MTAGVQNLIGAYGATTQVATAVDNGTGAVLTQVPPGSLQGSFTTSAMSNSTSITLSYAFTALTFTQTSTGNTVNLPSTTASLYNGMLCGFSIGNNVTNLTVSSAFNTVLNGAATATTSAGASLWWIYNSANTTWYPYIGRLSA